MGQAEKNGDVNKTATTKNKIPPEFDIFSAHEDFPPNP